MEFSMRSSSSLPWSSTINQRKVPTPVTDKPLPIPLMLMLLTSRRVVKSDLQFDRHAEAPVSMQMALPPPLKSMVSRAASLAL